MTHYSQSLTQFLACSTFIWMDTFLQVYLLTYRKGLLFILISSHIYKLGCFVFMWMHVCISHCYYASSSFILTIKKIWQTWSWFLKYMLRLFSLPNKEPTGVNDVKHAHRAQATGHKGHFFFFFFYYLIIWIKTQHQIF